jgi:hypothetical protein
MLYAGSVYGSSMPVVDTTVIACLWFSMLLIGRHAITRWLGVPDRYD